MLEKKFLLLILTLVLLFVFGISFLKNDNQVNFGATYFNRIDSGVSNGSVQLNTGTITEVLSKNSGRMYALICNDHSSNTAYLHLTNSADSVAVSEGVRLGAGDCYEIGVNNLWVGKIYGIASATTTLTTVEK